MREFLREFRKLVINCSVIFSVWVGNPARNKKSPGRYTNPRIRKLKGSLLPRQTFLNITKKPPLNEK
jgi:hypothetical protein